MFHDAEHHKLHSYTSADVETVGLHFYCCAKKSNPTYMALMTLMVCSAISSSSLVGITRILTALVSL